VDITHYKMTVELQNPKSKLGLTTAVSMETLFPNTQAISFLIGESLSEFNNVRLKRQMRLKAARSGSNILEAVKEVW
jgi:hypothetical protein